MHQKYWLDSSETTRCPFRWAVDFLSVGWPLRFLALTPTKGFRCSPRRWYGNGVWSIHGVSMCEGGSHVNGVLINTVSYFQNKMAIDCKNLRGFEVKLRAASSLQVGGVKGSFRKTGTHVGRGFFPDVIPSRPRCPPTACHRPPPPPRKSSRVRSPTIGVIVLQT